MENGFATPYGPQPSNFVQAQASASKIAEHKLISHLPDIPRPINLPPPAGIIPSDHSTIPAIMNHLDLLPPTQTSLPTNASASVISQNLSDTLLLDTESMPVSQDISQTQVPMDHAPVVLDSLAHLPALADLHRLLTDQSALQKTESHLPQTNSTEHPQQ